MFTRLKKVLAEELLDLHFRLRTVYVFGTLLPKRAGGRSRSALLRLAGLNLGHGSIFSGMPTILASANYERLLTIGDRCWFNVGCTLDVHAEVKVGNDVYFGQEVLVLTQTHEVGTQHRRAAALKNLPVTICNGAWIGARACILPGVTIGPGAVVGAGALVTRDVAASVVVGGVPATIIRCLDS